MDDVCEVIVTAPDPDWLVQFTRSLIEDRLCACGHHITPIRSLYRWQGVIEDHPEVRVALHTRAALVTDIIERTNRQHPYDVPCVIALPITVANPSYHQWILDQTTPPESAP